MPNTEPVRVTIFNQTYSLVAADDRAAVEELAHTVDDLMRGIASRAGNIDSTRIAVLACLHMADQLRSVEGELKSLKSSVSTKARVLANMLDDAFFEAHPEAGEPDPQDASGL